SSESARAIRFQGVVELGTEIGDRIRINGSTTNFAAVTELAAKWRASAGKDIDPSVLEQDSSERLIDFPAGRGRNITEVFSPILGIKIVKSARIVHTHLE